MPPRIVFFAALWIAAFCAGDSAVAQPLVPMRRDPAPSSSTLPPATTPGPTTAPSTAPGPATAPNDAPPRPVVGPVEQAPTSVFYVRDPATGKLVPLPGFNLQDFDRMLLREEQGPVVNPKPTYVLESLALRGKAKGERAEFTIEIGALVTDESWVRIPLRLGEAVVESSEYKGTGEHVFEFADDGYVVWIRAKPETLHKLTLKCLARVDLAAGENRLKLTLPRATTSSLALSVPLSKAQARITKPAVLDAAKVEGNQTEIRAAGVEGLCELSWWAANRQAVQSLAVLESSALILVKVEGQSVRTDATINIRSLQGLLTTFRIRLPDRAKLVGNVTVRAAEGEVAVTSNITGSETSSTVECKLDQPTSGPIEVRLSTSRIPREESAEEAVQFAGFEILGAGRQTGHIALQLSQDWQLLWDQRRGLGQIEVEELPEPLRAAPVQIAFEYFSHPISLVGRIVRRQPRVAVEPAYLFTIYSERIELEARFRYTVRRAGVRTVEIDFPPGWELDIAQLTTSPPGLVDYDVLVEDVVKPLVIPLRERQMGQFDLTIRARRKHDGARTLLFGLPAPVVNGLGPATVEIQPANNVEVIPQPELMVGLNRATLPPTFPTAGLAWQQERLVYRTSVATAKFAAEFSTLPREVIAKVESTIDLAPQLTEIEQRLEFDVRHEPLREITLQVPAGLREANFLEIWLDDQAVATSTLAGRIVSGAEVSLIRLPLVRERLGKFTLRLRFRLPPSDLEPASSTEQNLPLVMPAEGKLASNRLIVSPAAGLKAMLRGDAWTETSRTPGDFSVASGSLYAETALPHPYVLLVVDRRDVQEFTRIERAWIQSWLSGDRRRERVAFMLTGESDRLLVELPQGVERSSIEVLVAGSEVPRDLRSIGGRLSVSAVLPKRAVWQPLPVELRYQFAAAAARREANGIVHVRDLTAPELGPTVRLDQLYWEIILPSDEHLVTSPDDLTAEFAWGWKGFYFGRQATWTSRQLEAWVGAAHGTPVPPSANRYLFSHWGTYPQAKIYSMPRPVLVLAASAVTLVVGLLLVYIPFIRQAWVLFVLAFALAFAAVAYPGPMPLFAQASLLGVILAALAAFLHHHSARRQKRGMVVRSSASSAVERTPPESSSRRAGVGEQGSTATASIAAPVGAREVGS